MKKLLLLSGLLIALAISGCEAAIEAEMLGNEISLETDNQNNSGEVWTSDEFLARFENFPNELQLLFSFNYNTSMTGNKKWVTEDYINEYLKKAVTPYGLYTLYKAYLLEKELGAEIETEVSGTIEYDKPLFSKDFITEAALQLFNIGENEIDWQDFKYFEVEGRPDYLEITIAFSPGLIIYDVLYDTLVYSPDTNTASVNVKFLEEPSFEGNNYPTREELVEIRVMY